MPVITSSRVLDLRFPTSATMDGSDAMNPDGDYSAAYVILETDTPGLCGYGLTFTIGRGNDVCVLIAERFAAKLAGRDITDLPAAGWGGSTASSSTTRSGAGSDPRRARSSCPSPRCSTPPGT